MSPSKSKTRFARWIRRLVVLAVLGGVAAAVVISLQPRPLVVEASSAKRGEMVVTVDEDGKTRVVDRYVVSAPIAGNLSRVALRAGDPIGEGDVVARLLPVSPGLLDRRSRLQAQAQLGVALASLQQSRASVARAEAALAEASTMAARQKRLFDQNAATKQAMERADFALRARREELASAKFGQKVAAEQVRVARASLGAQSKGKHSAEDMESVVLRAPTSGVVLKVMQESEGVVQPGTPIAELGDPRALEIVIDVLTRDAVHIASGAPVTIRRWGGSGTLSGHVTRVEPSAFTKLSALGVEEQRVNVVVAIDDPPERWKSLGDGYRVEVAIETWRGKDVLTIPASAVFREGDKWAVFAVQHDQATLLPVELGHRSRDLVEITSGLPEDARVITHPSGQISNGDPVEIK